jgi:hypothetical protein
MPSLERIAFDSFVYLRNFSLCCNEEVYDCKMGDSENVSAGRVNQPSETSGKIIKYETYRKWPQNPTSCDYFTFLPLNIAHYFTNLSNAFGWKFVTFVGSVYGIQQGNFNHLSYFFTSSLSLSL